MNVLLFRSKKLAFPLFVLSLILSPMAAQAGSSGQQLRVTTLEYATEIEITGRNHAGNLATWRADGPGKLPGNPPIPYNTTFSTDGWWWQGETTITVRYSDSTSQACTQTVPRFQFGSDWFEINCGAHILTR